MKKTWMLAIGCLLVVAGCASPRHHAADSSKPPVVPGQVTAGPDLSGVQLPNFIMPLISGGVSVPKKALTPGAVTTTNTTQVCNRTPAQNAETIPIGLEAEVYSEYRIGPTQQSRYLLDLLVPISLGGAMTAVEYLARHRRGHRLRAKGAAQSHSERRRVPPVPDLAPGPARAGNQLVRGLAQIRGRHRPFLIRLPAGTTPAPPEPPAPVRQPNMEPCDLSGRQAAMQGRIDRVTGTVNTWIVGDDDEVIVIDPGEEAAAVLDAVGDREIAAVICTHGHPQHVAAAFEVAKRDDAPVALHPGDRLPWRDAHGSTHPDIDMEDGGVFEIADVTLEVISTPGHSSGSVSLYCDELGAVFTGDAVGVAGPVPHEGEFTDFAASAQLDRRQHPDAGREDEDHARARQGDDGRRDRATVRLLGSGRS